MTTTTSSIDRGQLVLVASVQPGDEVQIDGRFVAVTGVRRAQGRKPAVGENMHLVTDTGVMKANSTTAVRVRR